ncbi:MAG: hypothetical protein KAT77_04775 [Nanoarchaeota archaeon]|nr:hypothetical protein [Nanoarchaeota archaeon]
MLFKKHNNEGDLERLKGEIEDYLKKNNFVVFDGKIPERNTIIWNENWQKFLETAKSLEINLISFSTQEFDEEEPGEFAKYIGKICILELAWFKEGIIHNLVKVPNWFEDFLESKKLLEVDSRFEERFNCQDCDKKLGENEYGRCSSCETKKKQKDHKVIKELAEKITDEEEFQNLSNNKQREFYLAENHSEVLERLKEEDIMINTFFSFAGPMAKEKKKANK